MSDDVAPAERPARIDPARLRRLLAEIAASRIAPGAELGARGMGRVLVATDRGPVLRGVYPGARSQPQRSRRDPVAAA